MGFLLESTLSSESLEPLIDFLAFLVQNLGKKTQCLQIAEGFPVISLIHIRLFCHKVLTRNAEKLIKPSKVSYYILESN